MISPITLSVANLWDAFQHDERTILLIDEINKADIEFPNDLLNAD